MSPTEAKIYIDLDDVLCETARAFIRLYREEWGREVVFEEISAFDLTKSFGLSNACSGFAAARLRPQLLTT